MIRDQIESARKVFKGDDLWDALYSQGIRVICLEDPRRRLGEELRDMFSKTGSFRYDIWVDGDLAYYRKEAN